MTEFEKLDTGLIMALRAYEESQGSDPDDGITVSLRFEGDLALIEALGFETDSVLGEDALGVVRFKDIPALVEYPDVKWIAAGREREIDLDKAVPDIRARASTVANVGAAGNGLWHAVVADGALTQAGDATGKDVIVAIIDTGIDYKHPMFMSQFTPAKKTRILRIWDQGLTPASLSECPPATSLLSTNTYGVEYDDTEIDAALNGGTPVLHKDCNGHGTHVAAIAAGGVKFSIGGDAAKVGVAPEAGIIAVKYIDTPDKIKYRLSTGPGAQVKGERRFKDAVLYCLRTAKALNKPVVINMSFGANSEAGDGLDDDARWVDARMDPTQPAGSENFPTGALVVKSAGNSGNVARRQVAQITVPAGGEITVPLELKDSRGTLQTKWKDCAQRVHKPDVDVSFWYRRANPFTAVKFALRLPHQSGFSGDMGVGGWLDRGFVPRVGPPLSVAIVASASKRVHSAFVRHEGNPSVAHPNGGSVRRHLVSFWVEPKQSGGTVAYHEGIYEMRIKAPAGTEIFAMCDRIAWARKKGVVFRVANKMQNGNPLDPNIKITSEFSVTDTLGQHVITVAAYDDTNGNAADSNHHAIASFSSRGPLRDFSDPASPLPLIATKPDIAAPGVKIDAADGVDTELPPAPRLPSWSAGIRFTKKSGTSMSAPMVAGVIALMLDKKKDLNITQVRTILSAAARAGANPAAPPAARTNAYGSGMVDALPSHTNTP